MRSQILGHWYELIEAVGKNPKETISIAIVGCGYQQVGELIYNSDVWVDAIVFEKVLVFL